MTIYYIDTSQGSNGTGTFANPYNTPASVSTIAGDTVLFKCGTTIPASAMVASMTVKNNITIAEYGTGNKPIISGLIAVAPASFVQDGANGVWYYDTGNSTSGFISENDIPMNFTIWNTNIATTKASMAEGSFTIDPLTTPSNHRLYIKTAGDNPAGKSYKLAGTKRGIINNGVPNSNLNIRNLAFTYLSYTGVELYNASYFNVSGLDFSYIGANFETGASLPVGNGLQIGYGSFIGEVDSCTATDIFDTAYSPQMFLTNEHINDLIFTNLTANKCGMNAFECSIPSSATEQYIKNILVDGLTATNIGSNNWSGDRGGAVLGVYTSGSNTSKVVTNNTFKNITGSTVKHLVKTSDTRGTNRFSNILGTNVSTSLIYEISSTSADIHQYSNVRGTLSADLNTIVTLTNTGKWVSTSGIAQPIRTTLTR